MSKLFFRYGVMGSGKSTQLLQVCHDYEENNKLKALVLKPRVDTKAEDYVITRMGGGEIKRKCDFLITPDMDLFGEIWCGGEYELPSVILIDEAQFLTYKNIEDLVMVVNELNIPVICFGLRTTFDGKPFEGSTWLFSLAEDVEEITTRALNRGGDGKRATMNLRLVNNVPTFEGQTIGIEGKDEITYIPVSLKYFMKEKRKWLKQKVKQEQVANQIDHRGGMVFNKTKK